MKGAPIGAAITTTKSVATCRAFQQAQSVTSLRHGRCGEVPSGQKFVLSGHDQLTANPIRIPFDRQL